MKTLKYTVVGVVLVECILAWVHAPFVSLPFVIVSVGAIGLFGLLGKMYTTQLADRRHEREAWSRVVTQQSDTVRYGLEILDRLSSEKQATIDTLVAMGANLIERHERYYAQLPGGPAISIDSVEAEYWQTISPNTAIVRRG